MSASHVSQSDIAFTAAPLPSCQHWYDTSFDPGTEIGCDRRGMVTDLETGCSFCVEHYKEFQS